MLVCASDVILVDDSPIVRDCYSKFAQKSTMGPSPERGFFLDLSDGQCAIEYGD